MSFKSGFVYKIYWLVKLPLLDKRGTQIIGTYLPLDSSSAHYLIHFSFPLDSSRWKTIFYFSSMGLYSVLQVSRFITLGSYLSRQVWTTKSFQFKVSYLSGTVSQSSRRGFINLNFGSIFFFWRNAEFSLQTVSETFELYYQKKRSANKARCFH